ncbi:MAG: hypothetical protein ABIJ48_09730 [Actinomycetota bacterium]
MIAIGVAVVAAACGNTPAQPVRAEIVPDFFGEVEAVVQGEDWSFGPTALSQGEPPYPSATLVGPATIVLGSGRELLVPAGTPGSIGCMKFITQADAIRLEGGVYVTLDEFRQMEMDTEYPERCATFGQFDETGNVAWFQLFPIQGLRIEVGPLQRVESGIAYTTQGFGFPVADTVGVSCPDSSHPVTGLDQALQAWGSSQRAQVDVITGEVVLVQCLTRYFAADNPITPGPVQVAAGALIVVGLLGLALGHRLGRLAPPTVGSGALVATVGGVTAYRSLTHFSDGPTGWQSVPDIYSSAFDSWPYVFVVAVCATVLWVLVDLAFSRRWDWRRVAAVLVGSVVASVCLGLLDASL